MILTVVGSRRSGSDGVKTPEARNADGLVVEGLFGRRGRAEAEGE